MRTLRRDDDEPSAAEERAIEVMRLREVAKLDEIDGRLRRCQKRIEGYRADLADALPGGVVAEKAQANIDFERARQDAILEERSYAMGNR